ncbi:MULTISPECIES: OmpA family protein [unclassified Pseudomonas]|uniref:OmpA family protein n=1 Tax=unclassified Pseudomonas TaxID=196821 RepID=UPI002AC90312|nr:MULTISPECIES: OmpA family protein [unclassified Pseudomonas]MEB0047310.1 OmpA family protein [Pseudomonas sp. Dout3]MEB0096562.1 OmpA family protein [Pseudomonas sp. DC1.2]WPX60317.1 OmpA family protein [Pseudomonas sp. DC1.2]
MRTSLILPMVSVLGLTLAGCAATPENPNLLEARAQLSTLQSKPQSSTMAAIETKDAVTAVNKVEQTSVLNRKDPKIDQQAYIASQKVAYAEQTILGREAEAGLKNIDVERTQVRLDVRTQQLKALQTMKAKPTERGEVITFGDVLFDTGKSDLKSNGQRNFQQLAEFLSKNPERQVRVEGFTDSVGSDSSNLALSQRRADAVAWRLQRLGVSADRIITKGYGEKYPVTDNSSANGRQLNRRVEVIVSNDSSAVKARF